MKNQKIKLRKTTLTVFRMKDGVYIGDLLVGYFTKAKYDGFRVWFWLPHPQELIAKTEEEAVALLFDAADSLAEGIQG